MKAKRLTALALAALMAASTTSVALAGERVDADLDFANDGYYKYNSDTNRLKSAKRDEFQPGDDVYLRLEEDSRDTFTNKKTYNAYADWTIGDSWVKDIDIVYRKGEVEVTGSSTTKYTLQKLPEGLKALEGTEIVPNSGETPADAAKRVVSASKELTDAAQTAVSATGSKWKVVYYSVKGDSTKYTNEAEAITAALKGVDKVSTYYEVGADKVKSIPGTKAVTTGFVANVVGGSKYFADLGSMLEGLGWKKVDAAAGDYKVDAGFGGYGSINPAGAKTLPKDGSYYVSADSQYYIQVSGQGAVTADNFASIAALQNTGARQATDADYYGSDSILIEYTEKHYGYFDKETFVGADEKSAATARGYEGKQEVYTDGVNTGVDFSVAVQAAKNDILSSLTDIVKTTTIPGTSTKSTQYEYWVKITTKDSATTKDIDVVGSVWVGTSESSAKKEKDGTEDKFRADFTLTNADKNDPGSYTDREDDVYIKPGERAVVSFADDASDEFTVEFGDDAYFVFNARGQGKLNLAYNTKYNKDFAYDYDDANIDFINFEGEPTTNRTGTLYIYADEDSYIYEVTSKGAKKINGAYYDDDEEAWVIRTRNLTSYAISDKKLKTVDQMDNGSSSSSGSNSGSTSGSGSNNGKPNPDTGR